MKQFTFLFCFCAAISYGQSITAGVKGGGLFTEPAESADRSRRYVAGAVVELGFGPRFAVEGNALYSRFGSAVGPVRAHSVEFPVLGKFYFADRGSAVRPYASAGFSIRNMWLDYPPRLGTGRNVQRTSLTDPAVGAAFAGGVSIGTWRLRISPELRYTRWGGYNYPATNPHTLQALVGITF
jgi:hypothetical protein